MGNRRIEPCNSPCTPRCNLLDFRLLIGALGKIELLRLVAVLFWLNFKCWLVTSLIESEFGRLILHKHKRSPLYSIREDSGLLAFRLKGLKRSLRSNRLHLIRTQSFNTWTHLVNKFPSSHTDNTIQEMLHTNQSDIGKEYTRSNQDIANKTSNMCYWQ